MISVNIYQPKKYNFDILIPSEWNDLHEFQLHFIAKTLLEQTEENADQTRPKILKYILEGILPADLRPALYIVQDQLLELLPIFDFVFNTTGRTNLPLPVTFGFRTYYPVAFENMTCGEFEDCEVIVNDFEEDPSGDHLARLAAILFRPKKFSFKARPFSANGGEGVGDGVPYMRFHAASNTYTTYKSVQKEKYFKKLKPEHLYSILIWYAGCRSMLPKYFPELYRGGKAAKKNPRIFTDIIHAGAGPKNGSRNQIRCMNLYEFLYDCNQEAIKAREMQEEIDKMKT